MKYLVLSLITDPCPLEVVTQKGLFNTEAEATAHVMALLKESYEDHPKYDPDEPFDPNDVEPYSYDGGTAYDAEPGEIYYLIYPIDA